MDKKLLPLHIKHNFNKNWSFIMSSSSTSSCGSSDIFSETYLPTAYDKLHTKYACHPSYYDDIHVIQPLDINQNLMSLYNRVLDINSLPISKSVVVFEEVFALKANDGFQGEFRQFFVEQLKMQKRSLGDSYKELKALAYPPSRFEKLCNSFQYTPFKEQDIEAINKLYNSDLLIKLFNEEIVFLSFNYSSQIDFFRQAFSLRHNFGVKGSFRNFFVRKLLDMKSSITPKDFADLQKLSFVEIQESSSQKRASKREVKENHPYWLYAAGMLALLFSYPLVLNPAYRTTMKMIKKMRTPKEV